MKTIILISIVTITLNHSLAVVRTVSLHALGGAQYSSLQTAYNAASNGDTLILEGSASSYGMNFQQKSLTIIGQGLNTQKQNFQQTVIQKGSSGAGSGSSYYITTGSGGSRFYGVNFKASNIPDNVLVIVENNLLFENCMFDRYVSIDGDNITFRNCIFIQGGPLAITGSVINLRFENCIFNGAINGLLSGTQLLFFDHCLFLSSGPCFSNCTGFEVRNSIFMNSTGVSGISNSDFQNNLIRLSSTFPPAGNDDLGNNQIGVDPLLINYTYDAAYSVLHDYDVQSGSTCIGAASDGTDIGVHGGFSNFSETGEVLITPVIRTMNIINSTVVPNGTINIQINATVPTDD